MWAHIPHDGQVGALAQTPRNGACYLYNVSTPIVNGNVCDPNYNVVFIHKYLVQHTVRIFGDVISVHQVYNDTHGAAAVFIP